MLERTEEKAARGPSEVEISLIWKFFISKFRWVIKEVAMLQVVVEKILEKDSSSSLPEDSSLVQAAKERKCHSGVQEPRTGNEA